MEFVIIFAVIAVVVFVVRKFNVDATTSHPQVSKAKNTARIRLTNEQRVANVGCNNQQALRRMCFHPVQCATLIAPYENHNGT